MSAIFRSETMGYYQLILPRESAWEILSELGDTSTLHYIDDNPLPLINRPFANYIKRCEEVINLLIN
jgi:V-type H+-transporting ATPase subunit a